MDEERYIMLTWFSGGEKKKYQEITRTAAKL